ncbi:MAG TPA: hypothetical protein PKW95_16770 [bacterium]|nr:hypothetical protein [bacterium]
MSRVFFLMMLMMLLVCAWACEDETNDDDDEAGDDDNADDDDDNDDNNNGGAYPESCANGPFFPFDLRTTPMIVPYPNNLYRVADAKSTSGYRVALNTDVTQPLGRLAGMRLLQPLIEAVNTMTGFATMSDLYVPISETPANYSLPDGGEASLDDAVFVVNIQSDSPSFGEAIPVTVSAQNSYLQLRPEIPLRGATHYALVVTRALVTAEHGCYQASPSMQDIWLTYHYLEGSNLALRYRPVLTRLEELGVASADILALSEFTTLDTTGELNRVREQIDALAATDPPTLRDPQYWNMNEEHVGRYAYLHLDTPVWQDEDGAWEPDGAGGIVVQNWADYRVLLSLPKANAHERGQPYPVVIYGHPITERKEGIYYLKLAEAFAERGYAMIAMDGAAHGDRADGLIGGRLSSMFGFLDFFHPLRMRDNVRETVADLMWLTRAVQNLDAMDVIPNNNGDGIPDFDTEHIYYFAISLHAILGGAFAALEDNIDAFVMNVAGAKLTGVALEGPLMGWIVTLAEFGDYLLPDMEFTEFVWLVGGMYQHVLDAGDPVNFLPHVNGEPLPGLEGHHPYVLQQGASDDFIVGGMSGAYYCRAGGWPQFEPYVWDVGHVEHVCCPRVGSGFFQFDTANHLMFLMPETDLGAASREQVFHFLDTHLATGEAEIVNPLCATCR